MCPYKSVNIKVETIFKRFLLDCLRSKQTVLLLNMPT